METCFLVVLNLTVGGGYAILAVLVGRLLLAKAPARWRYILWAVAAFRLAVPVSLSSQFSLWNLTTLHAEGGRVEYIPENIGLQVSPTVNLGSTALNQVVNGILPAATPQTSMNPMQLRLFLGCWIWVLGMTLMALYSLTVLIRLRLRLAGAVHEEGDLWKSGAIDQPFVLGWLRPRIYLPSGLDPALRPSVLAHERYHLRRGDHWVKLGAFLLLTVHWFNPLCWLAFRLLNLDMEMSCDEAVLAREGIRPKEYSYTLLGLAVGRAMPLPSPLHFGESDIKSRIRNILRWKRPGWTVTILAAAAVATISLSVAANPLPEEPIASPETTQLPYSDSSPSGEPEEPAAPLGNPLPGGGYSVSMGFGQEGHRGTDFAAPLSTPVYAVADGTVTIARYQYSYGNHVRVEHDKTVEGLAASTLYAHMETLAVEEGETVGRGDLLGYVGASGMATGYCLHLELRLGDRNVDPLSYLELPPMPDDSQ